MSSGDTFHGDTGFPLALGDPSRYDLLLAAIPLGFVLSALAYVVFSVEVHVAAGAAALCGVVAVVDALFVNPPMRPRSGERNTPGR